jgi:hypothetical protein
MQLVTSQFLVCRQWENYIRTGPAKRFTRHRCLQSYWKAQISEYQELAKVLVISLLHSR